MKRLSGIFLATVICAAAGYARAQTAASATGTLPMHSPAVAASAESSRLRQVEGIYQQQLRTLHVPLLGKYLATLQKLASTEKDAAPYQAEIGRIQTIIGSGGVVDLSAAVQTLRAPAEMTMPIPIPAPKKLPRSVIALTPALARSISPLPDTSASPQAAAIGEIEWRIESLPPGSYEFVIQYSLPVVTAPVTGSLDFANQKIDISLDATKTTPKGTFRLLRLGQIVLEQEVKGETLRLRAGTKESTELSIRELVITRARSNP